MVVVSRLAALLAVLRRPDPAWLVVLQPLQKKPSLQTLLQRKKPSQQMLPQPKKPSQRTLPQLKKLSQPKLLQQKPLQRKKPSLTSLCVGRAAFGADRPGLHTKTPVSDFTGGRFFVSMFSWCIEV